MIPQDRLDAFFRDKEALFARYAGAGEGLKEIAGLCRWAEERGVKRAAVTKAPRANAELTISILGLSNLFHLVVTGQDCGHSKSKLFFEDSTVRLQPGVTAGMPVVAIADERQEDKLLTVGGATLVIKDYQDPKLSAALDSIEI
ncbi:hypothetical protein HU200_065734 [Digitaria exilis]|uniref:Uncharacterized protein n=1 Tax=Digitaria exilis TaxID=1010633 RepID=A0A834ZZD7_9POAL|nr:hypothetical protein HU200_065734 [Digitaria exilis]